MFLLVSSSRKPVIDPTKPLPPQATFLGPYINTGSRDVGPQKKWSKFSYLFKLIYIYAHCLRLKFLYLSLVYRDFEGNYGWEFFSVRGVLQSVCMVYVNFSSLNKKKKMNGVLFVMWLVLPVLSSDHATTTTKVLFH